MHKIFVVACYINYIQNTIRLKKKRKMGNQNAEIELYKIIINENLFTKYPIYKLPIGYIPANNLLIFIILSKA